jgi:superoxide dismutase
MDADAVVQAGISRAQETANQAFDLSKQNQQEISQVRERVSELAQRTAFNEKLFLNHHETVKALENSVTEIKIATATNSTEAKNMGIAIGRLENTINMFLNSMDSIKKEFHEKVGSLFDSRAEARGSMRTILIVGGGGWVIIQILLTAVLAYYLKT